METMTRCRGQQYSGIHIRGYNASRVHFPSEMEFLMLETTHTKSVSGRAESSRGASQRAHQRFAFDAVSEPAYWPRINNLLHLVMKGKERNAKKPSTNDDHDSFWRHSVWHRAMEFSPVRWRSAKMYRSPLGQKMQEFRNSRKLLMQFQSGSFCVAA